MFKKIILAFCLMALSFAFAGLPEGTRVIQEQKGLNIVQKGNKLGVFNKKNNEIIPINYSNLELTTNRIYKADGKFGFYNFQKALTEPIYDEIKPSPIEIYIQRFVVVKDGKYGLVKAVNDKIVTLIEPEYDSFNFDISYNDSYQETTYKNRTYYTDEIGYAIDAKKGDERYILRFNNKDELFITKNPVDDDKFTIVKAGVIYKKDGKYGFISLDNKIILKNNYDLIYNPKFLETSNYLFIKKDSKFAFCSILENKRTDFIYDDIYLGSDSLIVALKGSKKEYFNKEAAALRNEAQKSYNRKHSAESTAARAVTALSGGVLYPLLIAADSKSAPLKPQEEHPIEYFKDCMQK